MPLSRSTRPPTPSLVQIGSAAGFLRWAAAHCPLPVRRDRERCSDRGCPGTWTGSNAGCGDPLLKYRGIGPAARSEYMPERISETVAAVRPVVNTQPSRRRERPVHPIPADHNKHTAAGRPRGGHLRSSRPVEGWSRRSCANAAARRRKQPGVATRPPRAHRAIRSLSSTQSIGYCGS